MKYAVLLLVALLTMAASVFASFHLMQIEQVIGGVNGDTSAQAIQLRMRTAGQDLVSQARLVAFDATGSNPILILDLTANVAHGNVGDHVLIVSPNFVNNTSPATVPDFILTNLVPTNYLAAGKLAYEDDFGSILWSVSWGGTNYTGANAGSTPNDDNGDFGPPFDGPLPASGTNAFVFTGSASAQSTANATDYALTTGGATFVNNAGASFTLGATNTPPGVHDLAVLRIKAPRVVNLTSTKPSLTKRVVVQIQNRSPHFETITNLTGLVTLEVQSLGVNCTNFNAPLLAGPPNVIPRALKPKGKLNVFFTMTFDCANNVLKGPGDQDYRYMATVDHSAIDPDQIGDTNPANDACPRDPAGTDKGCGAKTPAGMLGGDVLTDVAVKP